MASLLDPVFFMLFHCKRKHAILAIVLLSVAAFYLVYLGQTHVKYENSILQAKRKDAPVLQSEKELKDENTQLPQGELESSKEKKENTQSPQGELESSARPSDVKSEQDKLPRVEEKQFEAAQDVPAQKLDFGNMKKLLNKKTSAPIPGKRPYIPRHYTQDPLALKKYLSYLNETEDILPKQTRAVIILTNHRSGSSFFGELFNQHPDAFYFFEPLFPLSFSGDCSLNNDLKTAVVEKLAQCDLPDWRSIYEALPKHLKWTNGLNLQNCIAKKVCFRCNTKELAEEYHCPRSLSRGERMDCKRDCGAINVQTVTNECRRRKFVVMKLIRLCDIAQLREIMQNPTLDVKVLHLLRDPRGIANSRSKILPQVTLKESLKNTCARQAHNVDVGFIHTPYWLHGRYKLFRYEDVATFPYQSAEAVYNFIGLDFPDVIKNWIEKNTGIIKNGVSEPEAVQRTRRNAYGTKRDSAAVVQKWSKTLAYSMVKAVESVCSEIMAMAGYVTVTSEADMQNGTIKFYTDVANVLKKGELNGVA